MLVPEPHGNTWTDEIRHQALIAVRIAADRYTPGDHALGYYVRSAIAHGVKLDDVCRAGNLSPADVMDLSDPAVA